MEGSARLRVVIATLLCPLLPAQTLPPTMSSLVLSRQVQLTLDIFALSYAQWLKLANDCPVCRLDGANAMRLSCPGTAKRLAIAVLQLRLAPTTLPTANIHVHSR